ncbi:flagellin [Clostridium tyrobutyricum]|uniref:flagellin N-terminal helical domain-containing protein n=1 Tax=Clostridium tyrobutyricum TaxID=1519 RepID=UPI00057D78B0|nr:flagellin [Clostridium tyrobutyricum]MBV4439514.1 flagellin [Clostridium tyrobutyricum]MBV4445940.1 flagellin [Clostridium tyrobutyricum]
MIINHNLMANNALRNMNINSNSAAKSMQKLSSGLRINTAADDAAGLAISEKMRGQINGLNQASANAQDGNSLIQTAEGALNETHSILQRMRTLSVQSANDTNTDDDRTQLQSEMSQLEDEINTIGNTTQFNTKNLLDGSMSKEVATATKNVNTSETLKAATGSLATSTSAVSLADSNGKNLGIKSGDKITVSYVKNGVTNTYSVVATTGTAGSGKVKTVSDLFASAANSAAGNDIEIAANATLGTFSATAAASGVDNAIEGIAITVESADGTKNTDASNALSSFKETTEARDKKVANGSALLQIGANTGQNMSVDINDMRAKSLGVDKLDISSQSNANVAIKVIDNATQKVSSERAKLGALSNRLDHTINNLGTSSENLTAAESRIRDVDMASEMSQYSKDNILSQAAQAMLAQANQQPQQVLQLLR